MLSSCFFPLVKLINNQKKKKKKTTMNKKQQKLNENTNYEVWLLFIYASSKAMV